MKASDILLVPEVICHATTEELEPGRCSSWFLAVPFHRVEADLQIPTFPAVCGGGRQQLRVALFPSFRKLARRLEPPIQVFIKNTTEAQSGGNGLPHQVRTRVCVEVRWLSSNLVGWFNDDHIEEDAGQSNRPGGPDGPKQVVAVVVVVGRNSGSGGGGCTCRCSGSGGSSRVSTCSSSSYYGSCSVVVEVFTILFSQWTSCFVCYYPWFCLQSPVLPIFPPAVTWLSWMDRLVVVLLMDDCINQWLPSIMTAPIKVFYTRCWICLVVLVETSWQQNGCTVRQLQIKKWFLEEKLWLKPLLSLIDCYFLSGEGAHLDCDLGF